MQPLKFMQRKNQLYFDFTGLTLIPENQLVDCNTVPLSNKGTILACPYCQLFNYDENCTGCPMSKANNNCKSSGSTFIKVSQTMIEKHHKSFIKLPGLSELIMEYNKANGFDDLDASEYRTVKYAELEKLKPTITHDEDTEETQ